ncbi:MAG: hypothetical protein LBN22_10700 [Clostridiales Family XIII bacterium]|nr:hypothetical protein [Clostridiales Family XIII bacterium]
MKKNTITKKTYEEIYKRLDQVSPITRDCGTLCNAVCCGTAISDDDEDFDMGIYLLPGEESMFTEADKDWLFWNVQDAMDFDFPESWHGDVHFIRCKTPPVCPREKRPIQCRTFPLRPYLDSNDKLSMVLQNTEGYGYTCPLIDGEIPLGEDFVNATFHAWAQLIKEPLIFDLVKFDSMECL